MSESALNAAAASTEAAASAASDSVVDATDEFGTSGQLSDGLHAESQPGASPRPKPQRLGGATQKFDNVFDAVTDSVDAARVFLIIACSLMVTFTV